MAGPFALNRLAEYGVTDRRLLKISDGGPATPEDADADPGQWSGLVPMRTVLDPPVAAPWADDLPVPPSVRRLSDRGASTRPRVG